MLLRYVPPYETPLHISHTLSLDFGLYVNARGEINGRAVDWSIPSSSKVQHITFAPPYMFIVCTSGIEVRLLGNGKKVEWIEGKVRLIREAGEMRNAWSVARVGTRRSSVMVMQPVVVAAPAGLLHLVMNGEEREGKGMVELVELDIDVMDLSA